LIFIKESIRALPHTDAMKPILHPFACLLLALALILSGPVGPAPAHGATMLVLCAGTEASVIWIDADGQPVEPGPSHPKCLYCMISAAPPPMTGGRLPDRQVWVRPADLPALAPSCPPLAPHLRPDPRGPPAAANTPHAPEGSRLPARLARPPCLTGLDHCHLQVATTAGVHGLGI